jgi:Secretion system C-terminal sorting domain
MKKPTFISIVIAICINTFLVAQIPQFNVKEFAPVGAKWEYKVSQIFESTKNYCKTEVIKDTIIQSKYCTVLRSDCLAFSKPYNIFYLYSDNSKVYIYDKNEFQLLYDFTAKSGDSISTWIPYPRNCGMYAKFKIDSTKVLTYGKLNYRAYWVSSSYKCRSFRYAGPIVERFGNLNYLFPVDETIEEVNNLTKYSDNCVQLSFLPITCNASPKPCNLNVIYNSQCVMVSTTEQRQDNKIVKIFPNPVSNILNVEVPDYTFNKIELIGVDGCVVKNVSTNQVSQIDVSMIPSGIYIMILHTQYSMSHVRLNISH